MLLMIDSMYDVFGCQVWNWEMLSLLSYLALGLATVVTGLLLVFLLRPSLLVLLLLKWVISPFSLCLLFTGHSVCMCVFVCVCVCLCMYVCVICICDSHTHMFCFRRSKQSYQRANLYFNSHIKEPTCILNNNYIFKPALHWEGKVNSKFMVIRIIESL